MDGKNSKNLTEIAALGSQTNINSYSSLSQRPSIEFQGQMPIIIKTEEEQLNNQPSNTQARAISIKSISKNSKDSSKQLNPKSANHNFQKHTVVTIKKLTRNLVNTFGTSSIEQIALQMWNIFLSSGIKSKRILVILYGQANLQNQKYKQLLKSCFFGEFCNYDQNSVRLAQNLLRQRTIIYLSQQAVRQNIEQNRHIRLREGFFAYFMQFVDNLKKGPLIKFRINSSASSRIVERIKTSASLRPKDKTRIRRRYNKYFPSN